MIAGLPLVFLLLAQQLCQTLVSDSRRPLAPCCGARTPCFQLLETVYAKNFDFDFVCANSSGRGEEREGTLEFLWLRFAPSRRAACRREWCGVTDRGAGRW